MVKCDTLKEKYENYKYNKGRKKFLRNIVPEYGIITEEDDRIICHATQKLVDKNCGEIKYKLRCVGMNTKWEKSKKIIDYYKLDKPVYYIFDGIIFNFPVDLCAHFSNVIFRNCTFTNGLYSTWASNVTLENNKYITWTEYASYGNSFIFGNIDELTIINDNFINSYKLKKYGKTKFGININTDKLNIINSNICAESNGQINIKSKEIFVKDSNISAPETYIDSESILTTGSAFKAENGIIIENKNCDCDIKIESPYIVYNGVDIGTNKEKASIINCEEITLHEKRTVLLNLLKNIKDKCDEINSIKIEKVKNNLQQYSLGKILVMK